MDDTKLIAYYILQDKYLKQYGLNTSDEEQILKNYNNFFPDNWELEYSIDKKIQFISIAIKNNQNLKNIVDDYLQDDNIIR